MVVRGLAGRVGVVCGLLVCVVVAGCGGSGSGGGPGSGVAAVGSRVVSLGVLEHWARVEGALANQAQLGVVNAAWVAPDPPSYKTCVTRLEQPGEVVSAAVVAKLKGVCRESYRNDQRKALDYLLREMWYEQRASEAHLAPTSAEVEHEYEVYTRREYGPGQLAKLLAYSGMSVANEMLRVKINMLEERLLLRLAHQTRAAAGNAQALSALHTTEASQLARLLSETTCRAWIVIEECRGYHA
jgi:hypothetical protein